jgi:tetratricopeptide (TPR) repeat protein
MWNWFKRRYAHARIVMGGEEFKQKKWQQAINEFSRALRWCPEEAGRILTLRAWCYMELERDPEAIADAEAFLARGSLQTPEEHASAHSILAQVALQRHQFDTAMAHITRAIERAPHANYLYIRALVLAKLNLYGDVLIDLRRSLEMDPNNLRAMRVMARILATATEDCVRDGPRALELAKRSCELTGWKDWISLSILAAAYAECGDFVHAVEWAGVTVDAAPDAMKTLRYQRLEQYRAGIPYRDPQAFAWDFEPSVPTAPQSNKRI